MTNDANRRFKVAPELEPLPDRPKRNDADKVAPLDGADMHTITNATGAKP